MWESGGIMPSTICIDEEYRIPSLYACEKCEKKFPIKKGKILFILTVLFQYHKRFCFKFCCILGFEFNPNCGRDDDGNQVHYIHHECINGTFNDGSFVKCQKCNSCPPTKLTASRCSAESDVVCCTEAWVWFIYSLVFNHWTNEKKCNKVWAGQAMQYL